MKNFIGGLFSNRRDAELARKALLENGIEASSISLLECMQENKAVVVREQPTIGKIGRGAFFGAVILGGLGLVFGLLVGLNVIRLPTLEPSAGATVPFEITWQYVLTAAVTGLIFGGVTGAILGTATRLALMGYRKVDTMDGVRKGDLMVAVEANDIRRETKAKQTMREYGARTFEEFKDMWDTEIWSPSKDELPQTR